MIDWESKRRHRVTEFLKRFEPDGDHEFEAIHRTLAQSYKVDRAIGDVAQVIGGIGYLLTGESFTRFDTDLEETRHGFEHIDAADGLREAERIFTAPDDEGRGGLLLRHARAVLLVKPVKGGRHGGYLDFESHHLGLLGGRELFVGIVRAMMTPYRPEESERGPGMMTFAEAVCFDLPGWIRPEVVSVAIEKRRHWRCWDEVVERAEWQAERRRRESRKRGPREDD